MIRILISLKLLILFYKSLGIIIDVVKKDYENNNGILTTVGPSLWHSIHTMSFNYPVKPTKREQADYYKFIMSLEKVLPCRYCRENFSKNMDTLNKKKNTTLKKALAKGRAGFSRYMYDFHNVVNVMLGKPCTLTYKEVKTDMKTLEQDVL